MVRPWGVVAGGIQIAVRLTPKGDRDCIENIETLADGRCVLKVRVRMPASEGQANAALVRLLAGALGVRLADVTLLAGVKGRIKRLKIAGAGASLAVALEHVVSTT